MNESAELVVGALAAARKAGQLYPAAHPAYIEAAQALAEAVAEAAGTGPFSLTLYQGRLYSGSEPLSDDTPAAATLSGALEARGIESLTFAPGFTLTDADALTAVLNLRTSMTLDPAAELASRGARGVGIAAVARSATNDRERRGRQREQDRALYQRLLGQLRNVSRQVAARDTPDVRDANAMVGSVLSRLLEDESAVLGLATIRAQGEAELFHAVNVMIYSMALGRQLGLPEADLTALGVSALLHDIGKAQFDQATPQGAEAARLGHPSAGASVLAGLPEGEREPLLVAYEHHMGVDGSGWPRPATGYRPHPFGRIVAVGNRYDNLVKPLTGDEPMPPERAVARLMAEAEGPLDPVFVRLFIRAIGVVPIGASVRLSDASVGVVCAVGEDVLTPTVRLVFDGSGAEVEDAQDVDLTRDPRFIAEVLDPEELALDPSEHL